MSSTPALDRIREKWATAAALYGEGVEGSTIREALAQDERGERMKLYCDHTYVEEYYGTLCIKCGVFYPWGGAPWDESLFDEPVDPPYDDWDDDDYFDCGSIDYC